MANTPITAKLRHFFRSSAALGIVLAASISAGSLSSNDVSAKTSESDKSSHHQQKGKKHGDSYAKHDGKRHGKHDGKRHGKHHRKHHGHDFVRQAGPKFKLHGKEFRFAGSNNYYIPYKSQFMADQVLETAAAQGFSVMRIWGAFDIGLEDDSDSTRGKADGVVYFQYWDPETGAPAYNDGPDGLERLDYVVYRAGQLGIKLIIPLVNNWPDFGGMDQYVSWAGAEFHDDFYTNEDIRQWYKNYASHLLNRTNIYTGIQYKNDPSIMMWELANEPRCRNYAFPESGTCTADTLVTWADEMSRHIKRQSRHQLVSAGDEGFFCDEEPASWIDACGEGVDTIALASLPHIDAMSYHLYPDAWGQTIEWGDAWIQRHIDEAKAIRKPAYLGEFGSENKTNRNVDYKLWLDTLFDGNGAGALYWMLAAEQDSGELYPDYDGHTVYCPSPVCENFTNFTAQMHEDEALEFNPVADHDSAEIFANESATLLPANNDIAYGIAILDGSSLDLDPATEGLQKTFVSDGGTFSADSNGAVTFVAHADFSGVTSASYSIGDTMERRSGTANINVTVLPDPNAALLLHSFESDTEGWAPASWTADAGVFTQSDSWATAGAYSAMLTPAYDSWFGVSYAQPLDLSAKTVIKWDVKTSSSGTGQELVLQTGSGWAWCQGSNWDWVNGASEATIERDLSTLDCGGEAIDLTQVHSLFIYMGNGGTGEIYIDNVRAE